MKPKTDIRVCFALIALGLTAAVFAQQAEEKPKLPELSVQVNNAAVRQSPSFLSDVAGTLSYGDTVGVLEKGEGWRKVQPPSMAFAGWMHESALTTNKIVLEATEENPQVKASQQEQTLGGRGGFTQEVEDTFRHDHTELEAAYQKLDRLTVDPAGQASLGEIRQFMREGDLTPKTGGVR